MKVNKQDFGRTQSEIWIGIMPNYPPFLANLTICYVNIANGFWSKKIYKNHLGN